MPRSATQSRVSHHLAVAAFAVLFVILASACEDFYFDSLPTPDIAQPTPANILDGDPEVILEAAARDAMAAQLGIDVGDPRKILFENAIWIKRYPGCYPTPDTLLGTYLIPGYRV